MGTRIGSDCVKPLALALSTGALCAAAPIASAVLLVTNCNDTGLNSLRSAVTAAGDGEVIDLSVAGKTCGTITLTSGEIPIAPPVNNLTIKTIGGAYTAAITVGPAQHSRIFNHTGNGTLELDYVALSNGGATSAAGNAVGGCIVSLGAVKVQHATISSCVASTTTNSGGDAGGGAISASATVTMNFSRITGNTTMVENAGKSAYGGAIASGGGLYCSYGTLSGNTAVGGQSQGGAASLAGKAHLEHCTVSGNSAYLWGAIVLNATTGGMTLLSSTVSGNIGGTFALYNLSGNSPEFPLTVYNSTIAFNSFGARSSTYVNAKSSIFANNGTIDLSGTYGTQGANNLVMATSTPANPGVITVTADPQLTPLADRGGLTQTHGLSVASPAIDGGLADGNLVDQRGTGFSRIVGGSVDIGAFERQADDDELYYGGFD